MVKNNKRNLFIIFILLLIVSVGFTLIVDFVDRQPIGPSGSTVGLATINQAALNFFGSSDLWDLVTDIIAGLIIFLVVLMLSVAAIQAFRRKSLEGIDDSLKVLFLTYLAMILTYAVFEIAAINYRPILEGGVLESSYPSSHVFLITTVLITAGLELRILLKNSRLSKVVFVVLVILALIQIIGRELAGVHWLTDIVGGVLFASVTIMLYYINIKSLDK